MTKTDSIRAMFPEEEPAEFRYAHARALMLELLAEREQLIKEVIGLARESVRRDIRVSQLEAEVQVMLDLMTVGNGGVKH